MNLPLGLTLTLPMDEAEFMIDPFFSVGVPIAKLAAVGGGGALPFLGLVMDAIIVAPPPPPPPPPAIPLSESLRRAGRVFMWATEAPEDGGDVMAETRP